MYIDLLFGACDHHKPEAVVDAPQQEERAPVARNESSGAVRLPKGYCRARTRWEQKVGIQVQILKQPNQD